MSYIMRNLNMKLLTVTVPCYNSEAYMEKCIESLLLGGDRVEIIVIDDGSKDSTGAIGDRYAAQYPNIVRVIHQENGGHGEGINQGLKHATGKYFKVVDSDDEVSNQFVAFLDALEACDRAGGVEMFVTNYYYVHTDGVGDRSINYSNVLPQNRIFGWSEMKRFQMHQMLTIHSCTFRTSLMREWGEPLPKKVFYEDNLMVCKVLPRVRKIYYFHADLYRYWIGRPDQSVQEAAMKKRYAQQVLVSERCFVACDLGQVTDKKLKRYLKHEVFMLLGIAICFARLNKSDEADARLDEMWRVCYAHDKKWARHFRRFSPLALISVRGKGGKAFTNFIFRLANKVVRFN